MGQFPQPLDLTGRRFGRLVVLGLAERSDWPRNYRGHRQRSWLCRCDCGRTLDHPVLTGHLTNGNTTSCGCLQRQHARRLGQLAATPSISKRCGHCGAPFLGKRFQRYCNPACRRAAGLAPRLNWVCPRCGSIFLARHSQIYCSPACKRQGDAAHKRIDEAGGPLADQVAALRQRLGEAP